MMDEGYRVIDPDSHYYGEIGTKLDKDAVIAKYGVSYHGRSQNWYDHWDLLLDFSATGVGFLDSEVERVDD